MKKTRFVFIALYLIFQAISAFALDKNLVQKKLVEGHPDYYREDDILHDIGIIESKKLGKLYIYFNEHYWGNYRVTPRLIICDENKILGEYGILLMDKPWIKNNLLCFPYEEEIGNKIDFNNGIPKTVYVDGYLHNFTIYDINLNESKTVNLNVYHYAGNNLVKYVDPDGRANILSITPSDAELFLEETKQALSNIPTPAIVCVGIASGLIIANELSDGAVFEEIADVINFIADKTIEAGKWIGEKIAGLFSKGDKAKPKTKDKTGDENSNQAKDIDLGDVSIWTKPPGDGDFHEGEPSREKPKNRGEKAFMMKMVVNGEFINLINIIQKCIGTINRR